MQSAAEWVTQYGYAAIFALLMLGIVGLPVPDETLLMFAGYLIFRGRLHAAPAFAAAFAGSVCGISLSYLLGRTLGLYVLRRYGRWVRVSEERLERVHRWFLRYGRWTLAFCYYVPGVRHLMAYVAGVSRLEPPVFALFSYSGGFIWCASFLALGYFFGEKTASLEAHVSRAEVLVLLAAAIVVAAWLLLRRRRGVSP